MEPQTVNLTLSTSGVVPVAVTAYNANTLILACEGDLSGGTFEELTAEIYQNANLGEGPLATVTYVGALGAGPHLLTFTPEQTNLLPSAPSILSRGFYLVVRGTGTGGIKTVFVLGRLTLQANPSSDIGAPPPAPSLYASNVFRYVAAAGSTSVTASGRDDTLTFSVVGAGSVSLNPTTKTVTIRAHGGASWQAGVVYATDTVVGYNGDTYICIAPNTASSGDAPGVGMEWPSFWKLASAAGVGVTNLSRALAPNSVTILSSTGDDAVIPEADVTNAGVFSAANFTKLAGIAAGATANATNAQLRDRSTHTGFQNTSTITGLDIALGLKADLVGGKLPVSQLPDLAISEDLGTAANQAAMLALVGQRGDWCTRLDDGRIWIVRAEPSSVLGNWQAMSYPGSPVTSVAGRTGAVVLSSSDLQDSSAAGRVLLAALDATAQRGALGLGALATRATVGSSEIDNGAVTASKLANTAVVANSYTLGSFTVDAQGRITAASNGTVSTAQINDGAVTNAKLANMAANTVKGSIAGGVPADLTQAQLTSVVSLFTTTTSGAVPAAAGGNLTTEFLRKDGSWATPPGGGGGSPGGVTGELQFNNAGAFGAVANSTVTGSDISLRQNLELRSATATASNITAPVLQLTGSAWNGSAAAAVRLRLRQSFSNSTNWVYDFETQHATLGGYTGWVSLLRFNAGDSSGNAISFPGLLGGFRVNASETCSGGNGVSRLDSVGVKTISGNTFNISSTTDINGASDVFLRRRAAANWALGGAESATPVAQTISVQSVTAGTVRAGALWTFDGSQGAGTGGAGPIRFRVGHPAISDAASTFVHPLREAFRLRPTNGLSFSNGNFEAEQDSIGELTTLRGYTTDSTNPVVLSEIWGPSWVDGTIYAVGQHVSIGRENWRCTVAHTAVAANNRPSSGSNWTTVWTSVAIVPRGMPITANTVTHALVIVTGVQQATGTVFRYMRQVTARNVSGLVTLQGTVDPVGVDSGGTTAISIVANDTDDTLEIRMTGISGTNIRWTAAVLATKTTIEA